MNYFETLSERRIPTKKGDLVRSKGEAEIANLLWERNIFYIYEQQLLGVHPDFLVYTPDGKVCVWEYAGPGMLNEYGYLEKLSYKLHLFKKLNPYIYKIAFSDNSVSSKYVLEEFVLNKNSSLFFSSIKQLTKEEFFKRVYGNPPKSILISKSLFNPCSFYAKQINLNTSIKLWIFDTSFFYAYYDRNTSNFDEDDELPPCLKFYSSRSGIFRTDVKGYPSCFLMLREAWELNSSNKTLSWIDLSEFDVISTKQAPYRTERLPYRQSIIRCRNNGIYITPSVDEFLHRRFGTSENCDSPEIEIQQLLKKQSSKQSQIQLLVDTSQFEYSDLEKPYEHLKAIQQKVVKLSSESSYIPFTDRNSIVRFEIIFEDSPLYIDIYRRTNLDLETHIRELEIGWLKYDKDRQTWATIPTEIKADELKARKPIQGLREGKNPQSNSNHPNSTFPRRMNLRGRIIPSSIHSSLIFGFRDSYKPKEQPFQLRKLAGRTDKQLEQNSQSKKSSFSHHNQPLVKRNPSITSGTNEQADQNVQGIGKNHAHNRRKKLIKRLKRELEPYADLKAMFEEERLPQDLEELNIIADYYLLKIKYKGNKEL